MIPTVSVLAAIFMQGLLVGKIRNWFFGSNQPVGQVRETITPFGPLPSDPSQALTIPSRDNLSGVSAREALGLSAVYRAVSLYALTIKQLSIDCFRGDLMVDSPSFIKRPDINDTRLAFTEQTLVSLMCSGNAYWYVQRDNQNRVTNLTVLNPLDVAIETKNGKPHIYRDGSKEYKVSEIQHLKLLRVPGSVKGLGPIQAAQQELRGNLDTRDYAANWFTDSGVPNGYLQTDQPVPVEDLQSIKEQWVDSVKGHKLAATASGLKYQYLTLSPKDAQFIESQSFNIAQVARLFGIPMRMMLASVEGNSLTYSNAQEERRNFIEFGLMAYLREIEDAFSTLLPGSTIARFNIEAFLRADTKYRYEMHETALRAGWLTTNEVRAIEGLPPIAAATEPKKDNENA